MAYTEESIRLWNESNVVMWLNQYGLRDCVQEFQSLQITGVRLLLLGPDDLKSFACLKGNDKRRKALKKALGTLPGNSMAAGGKKKFGKFAKKEPVMRGPIHQQNQSQPPLPPPPGAPPLPSRPGPQSGPQSGAPPLPSRPGSQPNAPQLPPRGFEEEQDVYEAFDEESHHFGEMPAESFDADDDSFDEEDDSSGQTGFVDIAAKFRAFGIGGPSRVPEEDDDFGDTGEDIYDMPPDEVPPIAQQGDDSEDEPSDIYDLPPDSEMMQIHQGFGSQFPPPPPPPPPQDIAMPYLEARGQSINEDIYEMEDPGVAGVSEGIYEMQDEDETEDIYDIADEDEPPAPARPPKPGAGGPMSRPVMRPPLKSPRSQSPERGYQEDEHSFDRSKIVMPEYLRERFAKAKNRPNTSGSSVTPSNQVSGSSVTIEPESPSPPMGRAPMRLPPREPQAPSPPIERGPPRLPPKEFGEPIDRPPARPPKESAGGPPAIPSKESPIPPRRMEEAIDAPPQLPPKEIGLGVGIPARPPKPGSPMMERNALRAPSPNASRKSPVSSPALQRPPKPASLAKEESPRPPRAHKPPPSPQMSHRPVCPPPEEESPEPTIPPLREKSTSPDPSDKQLKRRSSGKIADLMARFEQKGEDSHPPTKPKPSIAKRWPPVQQSDREQSHKPALPTKPGQPSKPQLPEKESKPPPPSKPNRPFPPPNEVHSKPSPPSSPVSRKPPIPPKSDASPHIPRKEPHNVGVTNSNVVNVRVGGMDGRPAYPTPKERMRSPSPAQSPPSLPDKPSSLGEELPPRLPDRPQMLPPADRPPPPIPQESPPLNIFREMKPRTSGFPPPVVRPPAPPPDDKPLPPVPPTASLPSPVHNDKGLGRAPPPLPSPSPSGDIFDQLWYHGNIDRNEVQRRLGMVRKDGCFLLRAAQKGEGFSLSLWYGGQPRHLRIRKREDNQYAVGEKKESEVAFPDILDLVAYHQREPLVLKSGGQTLLAHVCPKS